MFSYNIFIHFIIFLFISLNTGIQTQTHRPLSALLFTESTAREGMAEANKGKGEGELNILNA